MPGQTPPLHPSPPPTNSGAGCLIVSGRDPPTLAGPDDERCDRNARTNLGLADTCRGVCHATCARRSRRFSRPQRLHPRPSLQACCILLPVMGFVRFRLLLFGFPSQQAAINCRLLGPGGHWPPSYAGPFRAFPCVQPSFLRFDTSKWSPLTAPLTALLTPQMRCARCVHEVPSPLVVSWPPSSMLGSLSPFGSESNLGFGDTARPQGVAPYTDPLLPRGVATPLQPVALLGFGCPARLPR